MRRCWSALCLIVCLLSAGTGAAQTRRALVIGIDLYQPKGTKPQCPTGQDCSVGRFTLLAWPNLRGPVNDADAMAEVLTRRLGFPAAQVRVLLNPWPAYPPQVAPPPGVTVLPAAQTTRAGILAAMRKYLVDEPQSGDTVVFYYAGHGSLQQNSLGHKLVMPVDIPGRGTVEQHMDSSIVPSDAWTGKVMDVRDHEMTEIFNAALDKGVRLTVIFDSCNSGLMARGAKHYPRSLLFDERDVKDARELPPPAEHPGNGAVVLTAVQQDQTADAARSTEDASPVHGDFTFALIKALNELPPSVPASALFQFVKATMGGMKDADGNPAVIAEDPQMDAPAARKAEPLFGPLGGVASPRKIWTAALGTDDDGGVTLDVGRVSGIGVGSVFESADGKKIELKLTALNGLDRSTATPIPAGATVNPADLFVLKTLVRPDDPPLKVWMAPALPQAQLLAAVQQVQLAQTVSVSDPAEEPWTDELNWNGATWMLRPHARNQKAVALGAPLSASALKKHLKPGSKVWVNLPPAQELAAQLNTHDPLQVVDSIAAAEYVLTGSLAESSPQYAWFHRSEYLAGTAAAGEHSKGCSTTSPYPVRSDWLPIGNAGGLNAAALSLATVHVWMQRSSQAEMSADVQDFYHLQIQRVSDNSVVAPGALLHAGEPVQLVLHAAPSVNGARWVYVLDIDCHGNVSTAYPAQDQPAKSYPDEGNALTIVLPVAPTIGEPFGLETLVLLSSSAELSDPQQLNSKGATTRGDFTWGLERVTFRSVPAATAAGK